MLSSHRLTSTIATQIITVTASKGIEMSPQLRLASDEGGMTSTDDLPLSLPLELVIRDADTIAELCSYSEGDLRDEFARKALRIGVIALRQARGQIDAELVRKEGDRLLTTLQVRFEDHARNIHERTAQTLKDYFDPQSGRLQERVDRLVRRDGELEQVLRRQLGQDNSELSKTLSRHFGTESDLIKWLSPDQTTGLLGALRGALEEQLGVQREHVLKQFSLDNKEGALARFIEELSLRQGVLSDQLQGQIETVVKEFSLDDETSALSRLVANVERAQRTITREFSFDEDASALSRLKRMLEHTNSAIEGHLSLDDEDSALARLKRELLNLMESQRDQNQKFQEEVKVSLQTMIARKQEAARSTRHGIDFESAVLELIAMEAQKTGDILTLTGSTTGRIKNCKKGDGTLELGPESAAPGQRIVIEAKEVAGYQLLAARDEIDEARKNRDALVGLFIFSRKTAPAGVDPLFRVGDDVFVIWDIDDVTCDLNLKLGISLARALAVRQQKQQADQSADFQAIDKAILDIEKAVNGLEELQTSADAVHNHSEKMQKRVGLMKKELAKQIGILREHTHNLTPVESV